MTSISKNMYIDKLDDIVNEYINTYHNTTKMKPVDFNKKNNKEDHKFKAGYHVRILKYKNIFVKGYVPNWSEEVFVITKVKNTVPWTYVIRVLGQLSPRKICPPNPNSNANSKPNPNPNQGQFFSGEIVWTPLLVILKVKKLMECFTKKNCKKQIKNNLG